MYLTKIKKGRQLKSLQEVKIGYRCESAKLFKDMYNELKNGMNKVVEVLEISPPELNDEIQINSKIVDMLDISGQFDDKKELYLFESIEKIMYLVNAKGRYGTVHREREHINCKDILAEEELCIDCLDKFKGNRENIEIFCPQCRVRFEKKLLEKEERSFCAKCLQLRLIKAYNALIKLVEECGEKIWLNPYNKFVTIYVSILLYEMERAKHGYWYSKENIL